MQIQKIPAEACDYVKSLTQRIHVNAKSENPMQANLLKEYYVAACRTNKANFKNADAKSTWQADTKLQQDNDTDTQKKIV